MNPDSQPQLEFPSIPPSTKKTASKEPKTANFLLNPARVRQYALDMAKLDGIIISPPSALSSLNRSTRSSGMSFVTRSRGIRVEECGWDICLRYEATIYPYVPEKTRLWTRAPQGRPDHYSYGPLAIPQRFLRQRISGVRTVPPRTCACGQHG